MKLNKEYALSVTLVLSFFIVVQVKSFENVDLLLRDEQSNVFQEIKILKNKNDNLSQEIKELEQLTIQLDDQNLALDAIEDEIKKYQKLSGQDSVFGPGLSLEFSNGLNTEWLVDLVNALFNSGAQAVSVNGIRISNKTVGFDTLPQGQIVLNGSIISEPYYIDMIGEPNDLLEILELPNGILDRLQLQFENLKIDVKMKDVIQMV